MRLNRSKIAVVLSLSAVFGYYSGCSSRVAEEAEKRTFARAANVVVASLDRTEDSVHRFMYPISSNEGGTLGRLVETQVASANRNLGS